MARPIRQPAARGRRPVQLLLDFASHRQPVTSAGAAEVESSPQKIFSSQADAGHSAIEKIAVQALPERDGFVHPRAAREILLEGRRVAYEVKRTNRRTIGFCVGSDGLAVSAPKWVLLRDIDQAVRGKAGWIVKKLLELCERHRLLEATRMDWTEGASFAFLGGRVQIVLDARQVRPVLDVEADSPAALRLLRVNLPAGAAPVQIQQAVQLWLMQQAKERCTARLEFFAPQLGVQWRKLSISSAVTRWGSASTSGAIRLNWRLMHFSPEVVDYVVVHELSHLRFMDHSPRFWATVESVLPDHAALRQQLKSEPIAR